MSRDFRLTITDERAQDFEAIFGSATFFLKSPDVKAMQVPGIDERILVYELDMDLINNETFDRLVDHVAAKFKQPPLDVARRLATEGVAIVAKNTVLNIHNPQKWLADHFEPYPAEHADEVLEIDAD